jgi:hypothetical protein
LSRLESLQDDILLRDQVRDTLRQKANGTFLWVALVVHELNSTKSWDVLQAVEEMPTKLHELYDRMLNQIQQLPRGNPEFCRLILSTATVAYRPLHLDEIGILSGLPRQISGSAKNVRDIVAMCGSFLTVRDNQVYLIHQSAKDYLSRRASADTFLSSAAKTHHDVFTRSLEIMSSTLRRDMYGLHHPGFPIDKVEPPHPDPLATVRYSCVYWADHLYNSVSGKSTRQDDLQDGGVVHTFLKAKYLYWLEALSLLRGISDGVIVIGKLIDLLVSIELITL